MSEPKKYYSKGNLTEEQINEQVIYVVETIKNNEFVYVGQITFSMKEVYDAMDATMNIKDNMPSKFAEKHAGETFPKINPIIVTPIEIWREKYGEPPYLDVLITEEELEDLTENAIRRKKKGRRYSGKYKGRGKFKERDW